MRNYGNNVHRISSTPTTGDRIISGLSYFTGGTVGFIWIILSFATKKNLKPFVKFHAYQSILLNLIIIAISLLFGVISSILKFLADLIPFLFSWIYSVFSSFIANIWYYVAQMPIAFGLPVIYLLIAAIGIVALTGRYGNIPFISDSVKKITQNT